MDGAAAPFTKEEQHLQLHGTEALPPVFADFWRPNEHDLYSLLSAIEVKIVYNFYNISR